VKFATLFLAVTGAAVMASGATFTQCPPVGFDPMGCELLITVTSATSGAATGWTVATSTTDTLPFDDTEDTLIGIVNNTSSPLLSISFTASVGGDGVFDFDGDGACDTGAYIPAPPSAACPVSGNPDSTTYGHAGYTGNVAVTFSGISGSIDQTGTVNFGGNGIAAGGSDWFDLEGPITAQVLIGTPEPGSWALMGSGLAGLAMLVRRRRAVR
jgi:hypothetical protein